MPDCYRAGSFSCVRPRVIGNLDLDAAAPGPGARAHGDRRGVASSSEPSSARTGVTGDQRCVVGGVRPAAGPSGGYSSIDRGPEKHACARHCVPCTCIASQRSIEVTGMLCRGWLLLV